MNVTTARRRNASNSVASAGAIGSDAIGATPSVADAAELHQRALPAWSPSETALTATRSAAVSSA